MDENPRIGDSSNWPRPFLGRAGENITMPQYNRIPRKILSAPGRIATAYLASTFILFLTGPLASKVADLTTLVIFVLTNYLAFLLGTSASSMNIAKRRYQLVDMKWKPGGAQKALLLFGSLYLIVFGINFASDFGLSNISDMLRNILSPGESYKTKFEVFQAQKITNYVNRITQILTIFSLLFAAVVPFGAYAWKNLSWKYKSIFILGISIYVMSFLAIGTMKGLGDISILLTAGLIVRNASETVAGTAVATAARKGRSRSRLGVRIFVLTLFFCGAIYMIGLQMSRAEAFGLVYSPVVGEVSGTFFDRLFGEEVAFGVYSVLAYPSHGYLGLANNLGQPFEFAYGAGISPAFESYRYQYFGGVSNIDRVYLFRTEAATGWPAGMYWSTIFPWLASDLSFWGTPFFMFFLGWLLTRVWAACVATGSALSLAALGHLALAIAFVPANNQVLSSRVGLWVVASLFAIWLVKTLTRRAQSA